MINSKTRKALKRLAGITCYTGLVDYPTSNATVHAIVNELGSALPTTGVPGVLPTDVFDAFCHWWVSIYKGAVGKPDKSEETEEGSGGHSPSELMERFFQDEGVRHRLCQVMASHIELAHAQSPSCWVMTVRKRRIRLNIGVVTALEFSYDQLRLGLVPDDLADGLRDDLQAHDQWSAEFATKPVTRLCRFEPQQFLKLEGDLTPSIKEFVRIAAHTGLRTPFSRFHSADMIDYLIEATGRDLPRPLHEPSPSSKPTAPSGQKVRMEPAIRFDPRQSLFHKVDYSVGFLTSSIELGDLGLPELQRPFVWDRVRVRELFDSMFRGFPVGFLLLWSNSQAQAGRPIGTDSKQLKIPAHLVVDGQQRLTSLFAVFKNASVLKNDFTETRIEIAFRPRDGRFEVADAAVQRDPEFIPNISVMWSSRGGEHRFVAAFLEKLKQAKVLRPEDEDIISDNISRLQNLVNYQLTALVIQPDVEEEHVADIFVRINNQGVKLDQADFILTMLSVFWPDGRRQLEDFSKAAKLPPAVGAGPSPFNYLIQPGPDQMLRASIGLGFCRGRMKAVYQILRGRDVETGKFLSNLRDAQFSKLKEAQEKALDLDDWHLYLQTLRSAGFVGPDTISSENSVIYAYVVYLLGKHTSRVREPELGRLIRRWFVMCALSSRYSGQSESAVDADLADLKEATNPEAFSDSLERKIATTLTNDFWSISLPDLLDTSSALATAQLAFRAAQVVLSAPVLFSDKKVRDLLDPAMRPPTKSVEMHHLFPKAWLKRQGITTSKRINQAANLTLLEWPKNRDLSDLPPSEYVPRVRKDFGAGQWERMSYLHALPPGWESMEYEHFLAQRRKLMAQLIKQAFLALSPTDDEGGITLADASPEERAVWPLIEMVEQRLRRLIRAKYNAQWGTKADSQFASVLGGEAVATIEKNRAKHLAVYHGAIDAASADLLDYCYLGQLGQLMTTNAAWAMFQDAFRDKRQLDDLLKCLVPVRNDLAHFRRVPAKELDRCRVAADDLLEALARL